VISLM